MPKLIAYLLQEPDFPRGRVVFMVVVSGLAGGALLAAINLSAAQIAAGGLDPRQFFIALTLLALTIYGQHQALGQTTLAAEEVLLKLRLRIGDRLRRADLRLVEAELARDGCPALTNDTQLVSQSALSLALLARSSLVVAASLVYLGWISLAALLVTLAFIGTYAFIYRAFIHLNLELKLREGQALEKGFSKRVQELLTSFKEIKLSQSKICRLFDDYGRCAIAISANKRAANAEIANSLTIGYSSFYLLLVVLVMVIPTLDKGLAGHVFKITATVIYILSELDPWLTWIPEIVRADAALENLCHLEEKLQAAPYGDSGRYQGKPLHSFASLGLKAAVFRYPGQHGQTPFVLGPIELSIMPGEMLFVTGRNGSGKTTLLKLLAGLYRQEAGTLRLNGEPLEADSYPAYRELFAALFADCHLFEDLHGLADADSKQLGHWLETMGLSGQTGGMPTPQALSNGQKKRLALVAALLEDKPVYIFDQFAADQDAEFREKFYRKILPSLQRQGKTVIAATHDDRYFDIADRVLLLAGGRLA